MAKKQDPLTSFRPSDYSGFVQSTLAMEKAKAKADDPTLGFSEIATPVVTEIARQIKVTDDAKNLFMENLPDNFQVELVPPEMQPKLANQLKDYKSEYLEGVELLSKHANNTNSAEYKRGVEITEGAKTKMMNAYNGLVKLQQDRAFEIENNYTRGYVGDPRRANNLITGFNPEQIQFDELGNAVLNDGFGEAVLAKDYQRSHTRNASYGDQIFNVIEVEAVNAGKSNMNKASFDSQINNTLAGLKRDPKDADDMFYLGLSGDNTGETAFKNYINMLDIEDDGVDNDSVKWNGLPPSKSEKTMNQMFEFYRSTANMRYDDGLAEYEKSIEAEATKLKDKKGLDYSLFFNDLFATKSGTAVTIPGPSTSKILWNKETGDWSMNKSNGEEVFRGNATMKDLSSIFAALGVPQEVRDNISAQIEEQSKEKTPPPPPPPEKKPFLADLEDSSTGKNFFGRVKGPAYKKTDKGWMVNSTKYTTSQKYLVTEQDIIDGRTIYTNFTDEDILDIIAGEKEKGTWDKTKKRNFEEPNELDEVIQSNNNQTNTEFNGQLSEEASEIINSYRTATELQKAIDDGTITNKEVIDYVSMLKTENA